MKKLYYSIGEVARMTGLEAHVLRYWESVFPMLRPTKSRSGARRYKEQDLRMVLLIQDLVHRQRYSTAGALKVLREQAAQAASSSSKEGSSPSHATTRSTDPSPEQAEPAYARQADMFATGRVQQIPETSPPAESPRFDDNPGRLTPHMRLELLTIREMLKQLRDLL